MARITTLIVLFFVSVTGFAQLNVAVQNSEICPNETTWLKASGMNIYGWSDTNNLDTIIGDSVNFSAATPGDYTITVLGYTFFPVDTDTVSIIITVFDAADATIMSSAGNELCEGSSTELVVEGGHAIYSWMPSVGLNSDSTDTVTASPVVSTTYTVMITDTNGCMSTDSISLNVLQAPSVSINSSAQGDANWICAGNSATLSSVDDGNVSYEWSPVATLSDSTTAQVVATPAATTNYTLVVTDSNGCTASATVEIKVNAQQPSLTFDAESEEICEGESTLIALQSNGQNFNWSPGATLDDPAAKDVVATPTTTTTYFVTVTRFGCTRTGDITITVLPAPTMSVSQSSGGQQICLDESDVITVECPSCVSYYWKLPNATLTTFNAQQTVSPNTAGLINVSITGFDEFGCWTKETAVVNVDSCFVGDPWPPQAVEELSDEDVRVYARSGELVAEANVSIRHMAIFNLLGEQVADVQHAASSRLIVPTNGFAAGVYIARIEFSNGAQSVKKVYLD